MSLLLNDPEQEVSRIVEFIRRTYMAQGKMRAVVAVSGGIDSALSLTLATKALGAYQVTPVFLPYGDQSTEDGEVVAEFNRIPEEQWMEHDIQPLVDMTINQLNVDGSDNVRKGNVMARMRMIMVYDIAKKVDGMVCGTENKSEKYLGYFTRFGDEASDIEPIQHLYKTQVRQLARFLGIPDQLISKAPSAGLWLDQTDEQELGFTYEEADEVLMQLVDQKRDISTIASPRAREVLSKVKQMQFKHEVPYILETNHD
jgi:NAD+ synthase